MKTTFNVLFLSSLFLAFSWGYRASAAPYKLIPTPNAKQINPDTHLSISFSSVPTVGKSGMIKVFDAANDRLVDSLDLHIPAGLTESRTYSASCGYTKIPYDYSRSSMPTNKDTRPGTPSGTAEPTPSDYQLNIIGGFTDAFHFYPVIVHGKAATIYLHNNMLEYGHSYYVTVDKEVFKLAAGRFKGIRKGDRWTFTTKPSAPKGVTTLTVDAMGKGDFNTVQGALDYIPDFSQTAYTVRVNPGDYEELVYARNKSNITIQGSGMKQTKVHYANNEVFNPHPMTVKTNEWPGTFPSRRAAFMLDNCHDIVIKDITIATDLTGQAEGLLLHGERIALYSVYIIGSGDALQANGTIYMESCEMDGGGDTILGRGSVFAYRCNFRNGDGPFTWVRNTGGHHGDVFVECTFSTKDGSIASFGRTPKNGQTIYPDAECVLINCKTHNIDPLGWSDIGLRTARMFEFNTCDMTTGKPVDISKRHSFSQQFVKGTDDELINSYQQPEYVLNGWNPRQ